MNRPTLCPTPALADELCLQFFAGPCRLADDDLHAIKTWWRAECLPGEELFRFLTRLGIFHARSAAEIEPIERGHVSFTSIHHLLSPGGLDRLREFSKPYHDSSAPKPDAQSLREVSHEGPLVTAAEPKSAEAESPGTQLLSTLPIVRRQPDGEPAAHAAELPAGMTLGAFRLIRRIGRGVKGVVYEAEEVLLNRRVAVKVLAPEMAARGPAWAERFLQEARIASRVEHSLILGVYSVGRQDGLVYFAMPLMRRGSAKDALKAHGPYAPIEATRITRQAANALAAAHALGLSHGNLKPSNVFVGDGGAVKIADFAVPHLPLDGRSNGPENGNGTAEVREQHITKDLRHLGATYYWLLTGKPPARAEEEQVLLPEACGRIIAAALMLRDSLGFASAAEMADALADAEEVLRGTETLHLAGLKEAIDGPPAQSIPTARVGKRLGKCMLTEQLGQGSSGIVFRAWHQTLNIPVAVKVLRAGGDRSLYRKLKSEANLLAQLNHPHIVRVWDFEDDPALPYLVMEHVEGPSLAEVIRRGGKMQPGPAVRIVTQVASALAAAQKLGIIHRDVKPGNILVTQDGRNQKQRGKRKKEQEEGSSLLPSVFCPLPFAKLADLGLAVFVDPANFNTSAPAPVGTVAYMAPEQASGSAEIDHRGDIYSLGATFYHLVTGRVPFPGASRMEIIHKHAKEFPQPPQELAPDLPANMSEVILRMLAKDPAQRYPTYDDLLAALKTLTSP